MKAWPGGAMKNLFAISKAKILLRILWRTAAGANHKKTRGYEAIPANFDTARLWLYVLAGLEPR